MNTSMQIGGAIGIAITSTVAASQTSDLLRSGHALHGALTSGFHVAFAVVAGFAAAGALLAFTMIRRADAHQPDAEPITEMA